jgi:hypothetical protein
MQRNYILLTFLLAAASISFSVSAQNAAPVRGRPAAAPPLTGRVTDASTGEGLLGAYVVFRT